MEIKELWEELIFELGSMESNNKNKNILIGSGNKKADILFIGDDSDLYIDEELRVKADSSGEFLFKLCDIVEMLPEDYYITTLTKTSLKYKEYFENDQKILKELLEMQIALINPKIVVALGAITASLLLGREVEFLKEKGKVLKWIGNTKVLITYDPNFAKKSRESSGKNSPVAVEFWNDLKVIKTYIEQN
jgi:DNA polymerase